MILCFQVRLGAAVEMNPRESPTRDVRGRVLFDEPSGILHVYDDGNHLAIWPPPGTVARLGASLPPGEAGAMADAAQFQTDQHKFAAQAAESMKAQAHEPQRSPASDSPPQGRPKQSRR